MRDVRAHLALFVVAVVATLLTWNRDTVREANRDLPLVWQHDSADFLSIHYGTPTRDLAIERRIDEEGRPYYWGIQAERGRSAEPMEFPVGWSGSTVVSRLVDLRVLRDLGALSPEQKTRFGLSDADVRLTVAFTDERRVLVLGDSTFGTVDRYAMETATGRGYVISREIMTQLDLGDDALRERLVHNFDTEKVALVRVAAGPGTARTMAPTESGEWMEPGGDTNDPGFGNFMERVGELAIEGFDNLPSPESLRLFLRIEYLDGDGDELGFVEFLRDDLAESNPFYLRSESTRIIARANTVLTERVEQAVGDIF